MVGLVLALAVTSCSSTPSFDDVNFEQWVADNASKRFRFTVPLGRPGNSPDQRMSAAEAEDLLAVYMDTYGYCREGYFVYARNFSGMNFSLEGECQESSG